MFRCSLGRVCPRRRISPLWIGTPRFYRTSLSSPFVASSPVRDQNTSSLNSPNDSSTSGETADKNPYRPALGDTQLGSRFLAPSARGITPGSSGKDDPHALLVRAGYIRQAHAGVFHMLPLALRVQRRVELGLQNVMHRIGASEVSLSSISSEALWRRSGRIDQPLEESQHEFMAVRDRKRSGFILSPTHEEEITSLVSDMTNSYKDFPLRLFQISRKYRDELRPRQGLLRTKEFLMKDLYTFDVSETAALNTYQKIRTAYRDFFEALGVPYVEVEASSGNMGGSLSHEYHFLSPLGEDTIIICESCGFAANEEILDKKVEGQDHHQCPRCTGHKISLHRAIEVGHTFHLGTRYTEPLNAFVTVPRTAQSNEGSAELLPNQGLNSTFPESSTDRLPLQMGCHGIGVSRLIGAVAAMTADEKGLSWPVLIAPAPVVIVFDGAVPPINSDFPTLNNTYQSFRQRLGGIQLSGKWGKSFNTEIVFDDRDKPLTWKLKDADLVGYPIIVVIGKSFKESGQYEIQCRSSPKLSTTSEAITTSVATILHALALRTDSDASVNLGTSKNHLTAPQKATWLAQKLDGSSTMNAEDEAVDIGTKGRFTGKTSNQILEHEGSNKGMGRVIAGGNSGPQITRTSFKPECPECGKRHYGPCVGPCARCGIVHPGKCTAFRNAADSHSPKTDFRTINSDNETAAERGTSSRRSTREVNTVSRSIVLSTPPPVETKEALKSSSQNLNAREGRSEVTKERQERGVKSFRSRSTSSDSFSDFPMSFEPQPAAPVQKHEQPQVLQSQIRQTQVHQPQAQQSNSSKSPVLSHEHLLERVTLLERLMALKAEEDMLKKRNGNG